MWDGYTARYSVQVIENRLQTTDNARNIFPLLLPLPPWVKGVYKQQHSVGGLCTLYCDVSF